MPRLTARSPKNDMAYLVNVKPGEQEVDSPYPNTLMCILECFDKLAQYEETGLEPEQVKAQQQEIEVFNCDVLPVYENAIKDLKQEIEQLKEMNDILKFSGDKDNRRWNEAEKRLQQFKAEAEKIPDICGVEALMCGIEVIDGCKPDKDMCPKICPKYKESEKDV